MAIIGNNTLLGTAAGFNFTSAKKLLGTTQEAVLPADQRLIAVHIGWAPGNGTASGTVQVALLDEGNASANKPVIPGTVVNIPYDASTLSPTNQWISVTGLDVDLSAHAGKTLCPVTATPSQSTNSGFSVLLGTVAGATRTNYSSGNHTTVPDPFVSGSSSSNQAWSLYFETETIASGPTINSITDPISDSIVITLSEAAPTVDTIEITVGSRTETQSYTTGDDTTYTIASISRATLPPIAASATITLKAGATEIASTAVELDPRTGYSAWVGSSINFTDTGIAYNYTGDAPVDGDILELSDSPNTLADGTESASTWTVSQTVSRAFDARIWQASTETWGATTVFSTVGRQLRARALASTALESGPLSATSV